ncbi:hypothetical protein [Helicobacter japonicus]|uniref:hypothetical protein n=1 Tax=Helicobacter japonicus TaxID=425400 RepID=UPI0023CEAE64|nr:hypothetical protein [Helicobacter japonicus]MDE7235590.1 hypothetical protein [Helicobacter japonicus]
MKLHRKLWMQIHLYLSLFFLPAALIYAITGALYIFEIRQNSGATVIEIPLENLPQKGEEQDFILKILKEHNLKVPSNTQVREMKGQATMGNIKYSVALTKDKRDRPILRSVDRNLYGVLMMMHKSGGSKFELGGFKFTFFDFIAVCFGLSMILFYLSGLIMTSFCKGKRKSAFGVLGIGLVVTILAVYFSI